MRLRAKKRPATHADIRPEDTPFRLGNGDWGVRPELLGDFVHNVGNYAQKWHDRTAEVVKPTARVDAPISRDCCCVRYGIGTCQQDLSRGQIDLWGRHKALLDRLVLCSTLDEDPPEGFLLPFHRLYRLHAAHDEHARPLLFMIVASQKNPVQFVACFFTPVDVKIGQTARPHAWGSLGMASPQTLLDILCKRADAFHVERLHYRFIQLKTVVITRAENADAALAEKTQRNSSDPVFNLVNNFDVILPLKMDPKKGATPTDDLPPIKFRKKAPWG